MIIIQYTSDWTHIPSALLIFHKLNSCSLPVHLRISYVTLFFDISLKRVRLIELAVLVIRTL